MTAPGAEDRAFLYGDALFETVAVTAGRVRWLERHRDRLRAAGRALGFPSGRVEEGVRVLLSIPARDDGLYRVTVSRSGAGAALGGDEGGVVLRRRPLPSAARPRLTLLEGWHWPGDPLGRFKTASYLRWVEARRRAVAAGYDDALLASADGEVVGDASTSSVLYALDGRLVTPPLTDGVLDGVTRAGLLALGRGIEEARVSVADARRAGEIVLLSAGRGAVSAASLEGRPLGAEVGARLSRWLEEASR